MASTPFMFTVILFMFIWLLVIPISAYYYARQLGYYEDWATYGCVFTIAAFGPIISMFVLTRILVKAQELHKYSEFKRANLILWAGFLSFALLLLGAFFQ